MSESEFLSYYDEFETPRLSPKRSAPWQKHLERHRRGRALYGNRREPAPATPRVLPGRTPWRTNA